MQYLLQFYCYQFVLYCRWLRACLLYTSQSEEYKAKVLPKNVRKRVAVEALSGFGWDRYVGLDGDIIGMNRFGASAPYSKLFPYFGFTVENVVARVKAL